MTAVRFSASELTGIGTSLLIARRKGRSIHEAFGDRDGDVRARARRVRLRRAGSRQEGGGLVDQGRLHRGLLVPSLLLVLLLQAARRRAYVRVQQRDQDRRRPRRRREGRR